MKVKKSYIVFGSPAIGQSEVRGVTQILKTKWIGSGPKTKEFEEIFKNYVGSRNAAAVNSCTAALHLSLLAAGLKHGDEVITSAFTFCSTVNAIIHSGATPVLADIDPKSWNICPEQILNKISKRTRAIVPVHYAGYPCEIHKILKIADNNGLKVIEDCAHAIETEVSGKHAGTFGDFGCFSFYVTKNITTAEGGMILAKRRSDIEKIKRMALHGLSSDAWKRFSDKGYRHYRVRELGFKYNMTDIAASLGCHQLIKIKKMQDHRAKIWKLYKESLKDLPITLPPETSKNNQHARHLFPILINKRTTGLTRDEFIAAMHKKGIGTGVHYLSIPEHPYFRKRFGWRPEKWPVAMRVGRQTVSLPLSASLDLKGAERVVQSVREIINEKN